MKTEYEARILEINKEELIKKLENLGAKIYIKNTVSVV